MARRQTPQDRKIRSYQRDSRDAYGESPHGSRKSLPRRKSRVNRTYRSNTNQALNAARYDPDVVVENVVREHFKKTPDRPLVRDLDTGLRHPGGANRKLRNEALRRIRQRRRGGPAI